MQLGMGRNRRSGVDYILPRILHNHLAIRPIEADFHYSDVNYAQATRAEQLSPAARARSRRSG